MNSDAAKILSGPAGYAIAIGVGAIVVVVLYNKFKKETQAGINSILDINKGTPYEGGGVVGTLGNGANQLSGGSLSSFGSWLGGKAYDWFGASAPDMNAPGATPQSKVVLPAAISRTQQSVATTEAYDYAFGGDAVLLPQ